MSDVVTQYVGITEAELDEFLEHNVTIETVGKEYEFDKFTPEFWIAINKALDKANAKLSTIQNDIALKTGKMRKSIKTKIIEQVDSQRNKHTITISLSNAVINMLIDYLKYHTVGHAYFRFPDGYIKPTTKDTKPFFRSLFLQQVKELYEAELYSALKKGGFI